MRKIYLITLLLVTHWALNATAVETTVRTKAGPVVASVEARGGGVVVTLRPKNLVQRWNFGFRGLLFNPELKVKFSEPGRTGRNLVIDAIHDSSAGIYASAHTTQQPEVERFIKLKLKFSETTFERLQRSPYPHLAGAMAMMDVLGRFSRDSASLGIGIVAIFGAFESGLAPTTVGVSATAVYGIWKYAKRNLALDCGLTISGVEF